MSPPKTKLSAAKGSPSLHDVMETVWHKGTVKVYPVTDSKLEELTAGYNSLHLVFFGIFIGAGISFLIALRSTPIESEKPYYLAACVATFGVGLLFGVIGVTNYVRAQHAKDRLYKESVPLNPKNVAEDSN